MGIGGPLRFPWCLIPLELRNGRNPRYGIRCTKSTIAVATCLHIEPGCPEAISSISAVLSQDYPPSACNAETSKVPRTNITKKTQPLELCNSYCMHPIAAVPRSGVFQTLKTHRRLRFQKKIMFEFVTGPGSQKKTLNNSFERLHSLKLTARTWKLIVGRWIFLLGWPICAFCCSFQGGHLILKKTQKTPTFQLSNNRAGSDETEPARFRDG